MDTTREKLLHTPLEDLPLSADCKKGLKDIKINSLEAVAQVSWQDIRAHKRFSYLWFNELVKFLDKNGLLYLLDGTR
jgi:hypothetical protein